ncbi:MAG: Dabb family protein [Verrucomicrobiae bacterium]|nr:Dabb family protein [Verrucomicrobiae bacterium]
MKAGVAGLLGLTLLCLNACQSAGTRVSGPAHTPVQHVVVCWLKRPGDPRDIKAISDRTRALSRIPGVISVHTGRPVPSDRPQVDDSFDVAMVMVFEDEQALRAYAAHPLHKKAVREVLQPLVERFVVYDVAGK